MGPAIRAGADVGDARAQVEADAAAVRELKAQAKADAEAAAAAKMKAEGLVARLSGMLRRISAWMRRPDLPALARDEGAELLLDAGLPVPVVDVKGGGRSSVLRAALAAQKPPKEAQARPLPDSSVSGPGF